MIIQTESLILSLETF